MVGANCVTDGGYRLVDSVGLQLSSVEEELWRIFTFYSLHGDSSQPETLRPASFLRLCRDCQLVSNRLRPAAVELEVTKLTRAKASAENPTANVIVFSEFLQLIETLSTKLYNKDNPELAVKRILLENILFLAQRRQSLSLAYPSVDDEALRVVRDTYGRDMQAIFNYYADRAEQRRNIALTQEKMSSRDLRTSTNKDTTALMTAKTRQIHIMKEMTKEMKGLISHREFLQFTYDFNLKSTSLLTAIQVGEAFLDVIPLGEDHDAERGMSFDQFCSSLALLAQVAYAECPVSPSQRMKALLLYMWKSVNDSEKVKNLVNGNRGGTLSAFAGSLNVFGSGIFSDHFLTTWMAEGFVDYATANVNIDKRTGADVLADAAADGLLVPTGEESDDDTGTVNSSRPGDISDAQIMSLLQDSIGIGGLGIQSSGRRTNSIYVSNYASTQRTTNNSWSSSSQINHKDASWKTHGTIELLGDPLSELLRIRPELSEYLFLELQALN